MKIVAKLAASQTDRQAGRNVANIKRGEKTSLNLRSALIVIKTNAGTYYWEKGGRKIQVN